MSIKKHALLVVLTTFSINGSMICKAEAQTLNYPVRGYLENTEGTALNGSFDVWFELYSSKSGGDSLWREDVVGMKIRAGGFNHLLGSLAPLPSESAQSSNGTWLSFGIGSEEMGRVKLGAEYFAMWALRGKSMPGADAAEIQPLMDGVVCPANSYLRGYEDAPVCELDAVVDVSDQAMQIIEDVCYCQAEDISAVLDNEYILSSHTHQFEELENAPPVEYQGGNGVLLSGEQLIVDYGSNGSATTVARSGHSHDGEYVGSSHTHSGDEIVGAVPVSVHWDNITSIPSGFNDRRDNTVSLGDAIVAGHGGDFTSIQDAIDFVATGATSASPKTVWVAPGVYGGQIVIPSYVHLRGAGREITTISDDGPGSTVRMNAWTSVEDLKIVKSGSSSETVSSALFIGSLPGASTTLKSVRIENHQVVANNYGISVDATARNAEFHDVDVFVSGGTSFSLGTYILGDVIVRGGRFHAASGSGQNRGYSNSGSSAHSIVIDAELLGKGLANANAGIVNHGRVELQRCRVEGSGSNFGYGIQNHGDTAVLHGTGLDVVASGAAQNYGVVNYMGTSSIQASTVDASYNVLRNYGAGGVLELETTALKGEGTVDGIASCRLVTHNTSAIVDGNCS